MARLRRTVAPLGSSMLGDPHESPRRRRIRIQILLTTSLLVANLIGIVIVAALISVVVPGPNVVTPDKYWWVNFILVPVFVLVALVFGTAYGTRRALRSLQWASENRDPTPDEQRATLKMPWTLTRMQVILWTIALVLVTTVDGIIDAQTIPKVAFTIAFGGATVCAFSYLLTEFAVRPAAARALEAGAIRRTRVGGVFGRSLFSWGLGSGVPVVGLMTIAIFAFIRPDVSTGQLAVAILALGSITLLFGLLLTVLGSLATTAPINNVRAGMDSITSGDLDVRVQVYDGTELGELQRGFNLMADGLRDRERIRDLFGKHVGTEVAEAAVAKTPELGGEERDIAVFFIDLVGSTELAASHQPKHVVALLNRFFHVVVEEVDRHHGFVNKFEGDAALVIFGAPSKVADARGCALAAALVIRERLLNEVPECSAAIGVASGLAVAGNIGGAARFEYTVIGDPVNEAARLSDLAKGIPGALVASAPTVQGARDGSGWEFTESVVLRGRTEPTRLAVPIR